MKTTRNGIIGFLTAFLIIGTSYATQPKAEVEDQKNPLGCRDAGYKFSLKTVEFLPPAAGERNSLYFVLNTTPQPVNLYHMRKDDSPESMHINHIVRPSQWAVLSTSEKYLKYICTIDDDKSEYGKIVDCAQSIRVCEYINVKFGLNNKGNYWLVNSNTKSGAVREVVNYGIIPR